MNRLCGLDALRGLAALAVALHHLAFIYGRKPLPIDAQLAVDIFFILSGFVMARTYEARMRDGLTAVEFVSLRYRRLFLPLAIGSTIGLAAWVLEFGANTETFAAYALILAFMPAWWMANSFFLNIPAWSLFLEITANALHAVVFGKLSDKNLLLAWAAITLIFSVTFLAGLSKWDLSMKLLWLMPRCLSCYLMGILLYRRFGDAPIGNRPVVALLGLVVMLPAATLHPAIDLVTVLILAPLIVRASIALRQADWAIWLGGLSYPLYAVHVPVMHLSRFAGLGLVAALVLAIVTAAGVAVLFEGRAKSKVRSGLLLADPV